MTRQLPQLTLAGLPRGGLHLWAQLPDGADDEELAAAAAAAGVIISPGRRWFAGDAPAPFVRLTYGAEPPARLTEGVSRLAVLLS